ncbi:MAG TPA: hypothetical protein VGT98_01900, partial [Candidatus Elarobacter sp.]|nr:hypothetical protein [Candidatus Elarobacter sp.]
WFMGGGLSLKLTPPWNGKRLAISIQTNNAVSGLDLLLHGQDRLHGWGQYPNVDRKLLYVRGFDPATQRFKYAVNERFGTMSAKQNVYMQPMQLTMVAQLALGKTQGGPGMMGGSGAPPRAMTQGRADTLRTTVARTLPNVFRRTVALSDSLSLALSADQRAQLEAKGNAFQPRADSLATQIVAIMSAPMTPGSDPAGIATRLRAKTDEGHALVTGALAELKAIVTPEQWAKLPSAVTKGP